MSDDGTPTQIPTSLIAGDRHWQWSELGDGEPPSWRLRWPTATALERHLAFIERVGEGLFPLSTTHHDSTCLIADTNGIAPLSQIDLQTYSTPRRLSIFGSLGRWLRNLHDQPAPSEFGGLDERSSFHTFNAYMADQFQHLSEQVRDLDHDVIHDQALEVLTDLRNELSAFHPHGKSAWTVGRLTPSRIAVFADKSSVAGALDFSASALRPPEYDLASLKVHGVLPDDRAGQRAFWSGYGAAKTCDLRRRITYFERLIELEALSIAGPDRGGLNG